MSRTPLLFLSALLLWAPPAAWAQTGSWEVKGPAEKEGEETGADEAEEARPAPDAATKVVLPPGTLPDVVVTASRRAERPGASARSVTVVSRTELTERAVATTPDALETVPGVYVQKTNLGGGSPFIRGLTGPHVLLMVDGVRLNDATWRTGPNQYLNTLDPFSIARIEVVRGAASVLYGSDAVAGVVQVLTAAPRLADGLEVHGGGALQTSSQTWEKTGHAQAEVSLPWGGALLGGTYRVFQDLETPEGVVPFTGYSGGDFLAKAAALVGPGLLSLQWQGARQWEVPRTDACRREPVYDCLFLEAQHRDLGLLSYRFAAGPFGRVEARAFLKQSREARRRERHDLLLVEREVDEVLSPGLVLESELSPSDRLELTTGLDLRLDRVSSRAEAGPLDGPLETLPRGRYPDGARFAEAGLFALSGWQVLDGLRLWGGGRLTAVSAFARAPAEGFPETAYLHLGAVGALGAQIFLAPGVQLIADLTQGFRAPNLDDVTAVGAFGGGFDVQSPDLRPEQSLTLEAGVKVAAGPVQAQAFAWRTDLRDAIVRERSTWEGSDTVDSGSGALPVYRRVNTGRALLRGLDGDVQVDLPFGLSAGAGAALAIGDDLSRGEPLSRVPPAFGRLHLRWAGAKGWLEGSLALAAPQSRLAERDRGDPRICPEGPEACEGTPGYLALGLRAGTRLAKGARLDVDLRNLTNVRYRTHGSGIDAPALGAGVRITLDY